LTADSTKVGGSQRAELGMDVPWVGINSLGVCNAFSGQAAGAGTCVVLVLMDGYFSFLAFRDGELDFYRCKEAGRGELGEVATSLAFYSGRNPDVRFERFYIFGGDTALAGSVAGMTDVPVTAVEAESVLKSGEGGAPPSLSGITYPVLLLSAMGALSAT